MRDISLNFLPGAKIGVLGLNGSGKSTLLRIMAGIEDDFAGEAWAAEGLQVGFLPQEPALDTTKTVLENVIEGVAETKALIDRFEAVNEKFGEVADDADAMETLMAEQAALQEQIEAADAWNLERNIEIALDALRCPPSDSGVETLSGGELRRVGAVPPAVVAPRHAAARRADQPSRRGIGGLARTFSPRLRGNRRCGDP